MIFTNAIMKSGFIFAFIASILWGGVYVISQKVLIKVTPLNLMFINAIMSIILIPFLIVTRHETFVSLFSVDRKEFFLILLAIILTLTANYLGYVAIKMVGASNMSIVEITYPFFVTLFSMILFRTAPTIPFWIGSALIFAGSVIITRLA